VVRALLLTSSPNFRQQPFFVSSSSVELFKHNLRGSVSGRVVESYSSDIVTCLTLHREQFSVPCLVDQHCTVFLIATFCRCNWYGAVVMVATFTIPKSPFPISKSVLFVADVSSSHLRFASRRLAPLVDELSMHYLCTRD
jgi:hypothetical protein